MAAAEDMSGALRQHAAWSVTGLVVGLPPGSTINSLDSRAAMGLPDSFASSPAGEGARHIATSLARDPEELASIVEDRSRPFAARYAAGQLLALAGDPRIRPDQPAMQDVPGGEYQLGSAAETVDAAVEEFGCYGVRREWIEKEAPRHSVRLQPFRIARYPVTNMEYARFVEEVGPSRSPTSWQFGIAPVERANHPVFTVGPEDADSYADWLSRRTGRRFRLPSEAEWVVAASGGDARRFPWGDRFEGDRANTLESGLAVSTPVGLFPAGASPFGCLDMAGNVEEYVADPYRPYPGGELVADDLHANEPGYRVAHGGSFTRYRDLARCQRRHGRFGKEIYVMGFRLAEDVS